MVFNQEYSLYRVDFTTEWPFWHCLSRQSPKKRYNKAIIFQIFFNIQLKHIHMLSRRISPTAKQPRASPTPDPHDTLRSPQKVFIKDYTLPDGKVYTGELLDGKFEGKGSLKYPNNQRYEGQFVKGERNGQGRYYYENGDFYIGNWKNNKKEGLGRFFENKGDIYEGQFKNNKRHGKGTIYQKNGNKFVCEFFENKQDGEWQYFDIANDQMTKLRFDKGKAIESRQEATSIKSLKQDQLPPVPNFQQFAQLPPQRIVSLILPTYLPSQPSTEPQNPFISLHLSTHDLPSNQEFTISKEMKSTGDGLELKNETLRALRIDQWDVENVGDWLQEIGFGDFVAEFRFQNVCGAGLMRLTDGDLRELNIACQSDRKVLLREIQFLTLFFKKQCFHDKICKYKKSQLDYNLILRLEIEEKGFIKRQESLALNSETLEDLNLASNPMYISMKKQISEEKKQDTLKVENIGEMLESNEVQTDSDSSSTSQDQGDKQKNNGEEKAKENEKRERKRKRRHHIERKIELQMKKKRIDTKIIIDSSQIEMGKTIGKGTYGQVFLAKWFGQDVAVKRYTKKKGFRNRHIARFLQQAQITSKLLHPNIVLYMGMFTYNNDYAIVMEHMEGGSLFDYIHLKGYKLAQSRIIAICKNVAIAMCYLHCKDIVHCDLKSSNLLLDRYWKVKISDFGLSQILDAKECKKQRSTRLGTPQWMAPEVMRGEKYQPACDVYSFGMILWQLLTCEIPFRELAEKQIIEKVGKNETFTITPPKYQNKDLVRLFLKCTERSAEKRPNFIHIVRQLQRCQNQMIRNRKKS